MVANANGSDKYLRVWIVGDEDQLHHEVKEIDYDLEMVITSCGLLQQGVRVTPDIDLMCSRCKVLADGT